MFFKVPLLFFVGLYFFNINSKCFMVNKCMNLYMKRDKISNLNVINKPRGFNQKIYSEYLDNSNNSIIVAVGPAGTGKTMFACIKAIKMLKSGQFNKIIITRPVVPVEEDIGFLPGNIAKKMDPWTRPILDIFMEHYSKTEVDNMIYNNIIEISPLAYMRGRTFKNALIIADEMQNSSPNQMMMLTTRIGENSRMVITGDLKQSDKSMNNGLSDLINKLKTYYNYDLSNENTTIKLVEFNVSDVERSEIVKKVIDIYNYKKKDDVIVKTSVNSTELVNNTENKIQEIVDCNITKKSNNCFHKYTASDFDAALIPKSQSFRKIWEQ